VTSLWTLASLLLLGQAAPAAAPGTEIRAFTATILDDKGGEVADLSAQDVTVAENGVTRDVVSFKRDARPLSVALIVDSSVGTTSIYRLNMVDAVTGFVSRLPDGARYAVWTTGDRPTKVVDYTEDHEAAGRALRMVASQGGNYLLDAISEASVDQKKLLREGDRSVVVVLTASGPELSYRDRYRAAEEGEKSGAVFLAAQIDSGDTQMEVRENVSYVLDRLASTSGGRHDTILSAMSSDGAMRRLSAALRSAYRVVYASVPGLKKRKVELSVARPKTKVLLPASTERDAAAAGAEPRP
jgi:VWFA-related protein